MDLKSFVRVVPDFPQAGVMFRDVTTLFNNAEAFAEVVKQFQSVWSGYEIDAIAGIDARGFIIGSALAYSMGLPLILLRKKGKLPYKTISEEYDLEYGKSVLEIHEGDIEKGANVLIVDDLIATGGTATAGIKLVEAAGGNAMGCGAIIDLPDLHGSTKLETMGITVKSLLIFRGH